MTKSYQTNKIHIYKYKQENKDKIKDYDRLRKYKQYHFNKAWLELCNIRL